MVALRTAPPQGAGARRSRCVGNEGIAERERSGVGGGTDE